MEGSQVLAGRYHNKQEFIDATFGRPDSLLQGGVKLEVEHLYVDGDTTIATRPMQSIGVLREPLAAVPV